MIIYFYPGRQERFTTVLSRTAIVITISLI